MFKKIVDCLKLFDGLMKFLVLELCFAVFVELGFCEFDSVEALLLWGKGRRWGGSWSLG